MNAAINSGLTQAKNGESIMFTVTISSESPMTSASIDIIPCAELFPQTELIPNALSINADGINIYAVNSDTGIFEVTIPDIPSLTSLSFSYSAQAENLSQKCTTAAMITVNHSGSVIEEGYAQSFISPTPSVCVIPAAASIGAVILSGFIIYRILLHSR